MDMRKRIKAKQIGALCLAGTMLFQIWGCSGTPDQTVSDSKAGSGNDSAVSEGTEAVYTAKEYIDENQVDKAEVVYARANAAGSVQEIRVEAVLKNHGGLEDITDCSNLTDIRNTEGDEEWKQADLGKSWRGHFIQRKCIRGTSGRCFHSLRAGWKRNCSTGADWKKRSCEASF